MPSSFFLQSLYALLLFIPLITLHEVAHAWAARWLGDDEAEDEGRLTLNPLAHIDIWGTLLLPFINLLINHGILPLGYGRPVPFTPDERYPRLQNVLFALAGPVASLLLSFVLIAARVLLLAPDSSWANLLETAAYISAFIAVAHLLIPLPPFDGWLILGSFVPLPEEILERGSVWWFVALFVLLNFTHILSYVDLFANCFLSLSAHLSLLLK